MTGPKRRVRVRLAALFAVLLLTTLASFDWPDPGEASSQRVLSVTAFPREVAARGGESEIIVRIPAAAAGEHTHVTLSTEVGAFGAASGPPQIDVPAGGCRQRHPRLEGRSWSVTVGSVRPSSALKLGRWLIRCPSVSSARRRPCGWNGPAQGRDSTHRCSMKSGWLRPTSRRSEFPRPASLSIWSRLPPVHRCAVARGRPRHRSPSARTAVARCQCGSGRIPATSRSARRAASPR